MLEYLHIKNVALIKDIEINFSKGLNILSGETGSGKSMIISALKFVLGERISKDFIRKSEKEAFVEAIFVQKENFSNILKELEIREEDDGSIIISRTINQNGRTINKINGETVPQSTLKQLSEYMYDMHSQHEHQSLLNPNKHIFLLDKFCENIFVLKEELDKLLKEYKILDKEIQSLNLDEKEKEQKIEILSYQIDEIEKSKLKNGEEEELLEKKKKALNSEKIRSLSNESYKFLYEGFENEKPILESLSKVLDNISELKDFDNEFESIYERLYESFENLSDCSSEIGKYIRENDLIKDDIEEIEERLDTIYKLKRKYGNSVSEILSYYYNIKEQLTNLNLNDERLKELTEKRKGLYRKMFTLCEEISSERKQNAEEIEKAVTEHLHDLEMKNASFKIKIEDKKKISHDGKDSVEFLISPNLGEELKPLSKIASGGEMSRVMLSLKSVLSEADNIDTFVFDEIDSGISGRTAQKAGEKMCKIAKEKQILCITHLPQIAAMADSHFLIEKHEEDNNTFTTVKELTEKERVNEISRLMSGSVITDLSKKAAEELIYNAIEYKNL